MKIVVLYHASCADGFCSAWVAHRLFGEKADYIPVQYGNPIPEIPDGAEVYILDFSYPAPILVALAARSNSVTVLDHHKTAKADLEFLKAENLSITFDMEKSGGRLTWEHFNPGEKSPWLVDYTEDRDLWRWKLPNSQCVSAALASLPLDFTAWDLLHTANRLDVMATDGAAILRYQSQQVESQCKNAVEIELAGHKILAVNATMLISEIAGKLAEGRAFGASYFITGDGKKVWSLRSRDGGIDVSEIAKRFGGGGHRNAAGFTTQVA